MKYIMICMLLISVAMVSAERIEGSPSNLTTKTQESVKVSGEIFDIPEGAVYGEPKGSIDPADLVNEDDPTSGMIHSSPHSRLMWEKVEEPSTWPGLEWGNDIMVYGGEVGENQDFDVDESTNDIYAIFDTYHTTNDSANVYRSTDGGATWSFWRANVNTDGEVGNPKIRVAQDGSGQTWVCMFGIWHETSGDDILYMRRMTPDQSQSAWEEVNSTVDFADVDADVGTGAWVYVTYILSDSENDIYAARNLLGGAGWQDDQVLFANPQVFPHPQIAAGAGGNLAVTFIDDRLTTNQEVRIKRSTNYASSWLGSEQVSNNSGAAPLLYTDIGYSHGATQTGWIFVTFDWGSGEQNLGYYYSQNSGVNWTYGAVIGVSSDAENLGSLRCLKSSGALTVAYNHDPGDSTMFTWASTSSPTNFSAVERINDQPATSIWRPTAGWITSGGNWSAIMYSDIGPYNLYFDWFGNPGIEEVTSELSTSMLNIRPNPSHNVAELSYVVANQGFVNITIFDALGRVVETVVNETKNAGEYSFTMNNEKLASGVYFVKIETPQGITGRTMTIIR